MSAAAPPTALADDVRTAPEPGTGHRLSAGAAWAALILLFPLARLAVFLGKPAALQQRDFTDDFYYYALIARHLADGAGSSFGGLVDTNGYQPLWQMLLVPLARLAEGDAFLRLVYGVETALFALTLALAWLIARRVGASTAGAYAAAYAVAIGASAGNLFFQGMEIVVLLPLVLAVILAVLVVADPGRPPRPVRDGLVLGALLFLLAMARLDTLALPVALGAVTAGRLLLAPGRRRPRLGTAAVAAGVLGGGLAGYAVLNLALFGMPVPVSGLAKALGGGSLRTDLVGQYLSFGVVGPVHGLLGAQAVAAVVAALVLLRRAAVRGRALLGWADRPVATVLAALLLAQVAQLGYYTVTSSWPLWPWYFYYIPVMLLLGLLVLVRAVLSTPVAVVAGRAWPAVAVALAACALAVGVSWGKPPAAFWDGGVPAAAEWITTHTRPTDVVAVGDRAGYLTWLTHRPTVQLEGLVEDAGYLDVVQHRRIAQHLAAQGVRWYVRGDDLPGGPTAPVPHRPGCTGQLEPAMGGGPKSVVVACDQELVYSAVEQAYRWRIWRFTP